MKTQLLKLEKYWISNDQARVKTTHRWSLTLIMHLRGSIQFLIQCYVSSICISCLLLHSVHLTESLTEIGSSTTVSFVWVQERVNPGWGYPQCSGWLITRKGNRMGGPWPPHRDSAHPLFWHSPRFMMKLKATNSNKYEIFISKQNIQSLCSGMVLIIVKIY